MPAGSRAQAHQAASHTRECTWLSMRREVMSMGRCICPCVLQKCPPCGSTANLSPGLTCTRVQGVSSQGSQ